MTRHTARFLALTTFAAFAAAAQPGALAHGVSENTESIEVAIDVAAEQLLQSDPSVAAKIRKIGAALAKKSAEKSFSAELSAVAKASRLADQLPAGAETDSVRAAFTASLAAYRSDLLSANDRMTLALSAQGLSSGVAKKLGRARDKLAGLIVDINGAATTTEAYLAMKAAAKAATGYTAYDGGCEYTWVMSSLALAPAGAGVDLNGDRRPDNALGDLLAALSGLGGGGIDPDFGAALQSSSNVFLLQMWGVQKFQADPVVFVGLLGGADTDMDTSDNFNGSEDFEVVGGALGADGNAALRGATSLKRGGNYQFKLTGQSLALVGIAIPANGTVAIEGTATADLNSGVIGATLPTQALLDLFANVGVTIPPLFLPAFEAFADLDLDEDGVNDAYSAAFTFRAVPAVVHEAP